MPDRIARHRGHPCARAVTVGSWATLVRGFVCWPLTLTWACVDLAYVDQGYAGERAAQAAADHGITLERW